MTRTSHSFAMGVVPGLPKSASTPLRVVWEVGMPASVPVALLPATFFCPFRASEWQHSIHYQKPAAERRKNLAHSISCRKASRRKPTQPGKAERTRPEDKTFKGSANLWNHPSPLPGLGEVGNPIKSYASRRGLKSAGGLRFQTKAQPSETGCLPGCEGKIRHHHRSNA